MKKSYDKINKVWISVSDDVFEEYRNDTNVYCRKNQRHGNCKCPRSKRWLCDLDCPMCEFYICDESLDEPIGESENTLIDLLPSNSPSVESVIENKELLNALRKELSKLSDEDLKMCRLLANNTQTETAKKMRISRDALRWRWKKVQERLAKNLKKFF